jgi:Xaa-Pro dipeptidase
MKYLEARRDRVYDWMAQEGIALVMLEDTEGRRDLGVRWLTGQPGDALLMLSVDRRALLIPWDINMARVYAQADYLIPYGEFDRQPTKALRAAAVYLKIPYGSRLEIPPETPYPLFLNYVEEASDYDVICRNSGAHGMIRDLRAVKDEEEIGIYRRAAKITNDIIDLLETQVRAGKLKTEAEVALFIEAEGRKRHCEGTGFETLAAGASRSFGIHAFPAYTGAAFSDPGLSILDFGMKYQGYTTDVTLTFARPPLSKPQERLLGLTEKAYKLALGMAVEGAAVRGIALAVDELFGKSRKVMPHGLGHGIGLEAHEAPFLRGRSDRNLLLKPGMIITLEPGLYDPIHGGCRLENDILITDAGAEVLTRGRIIRL